MATDWRIQRFIQATRAHAFDLDPALVPMIIAEVDSILLGGRPGKRVQTIRKQGKIYLRRTFIRPHVLLHEFMQSDGADPHDHPWDFASVILKGGYVEHWTDRRQTRTFKERSITRHLATDVHRVELLETPTITLCITGPMLRKWGFHTKAGFVPRDDYIASSRGVEKVEWAG